MTRASLPLLLASPLLVLSACTEGTYTRDGGASSSGVPSGITFQDIGTPCTCEVNLATLGCSRAPVNSCAKSALNCVIVTYDSFANAGNPLWEATMFSRGRVADGGVVIDGECTLTGNVFQLPSCPQGTMPITLSNGLVACKRICQSDQDCGRTGWVCDAPLLNRNGIDVSFPPVEAPLDLKICKPACVTDFPDCLRTTPCNLGRPGCFKSPLVNGPQGLGIYVGDRNGGRACSPTTGKCEPTTARNDLAVLGAACSGNVDCPSQHLCVSDVAYADNPSGSGFCTYADCDPLAAAGAVGACVQGLTCEYAFEHGMCFPDCAGGTLCGLGQVCGTADPARVVNYDPVTGYPRAWKGNHCIDCRMSTNTGMCP
jgi:hypothetical protein